MGAIFSVLFLAACAAACYVILGVIRPRLGDCDAVARFLLSFVVFFAFFYSSLLILGYVSLFTELRIVTPLHAFVLSTIVALGLRLTLGNPAPYLDKRDYQLELSPPARDRLSRHLVRLSLTLFCVIGVVLVATGFPRGYEAAAYHLPIGVNFFQTQSLNVWDETFSSGLPANAGILYGFLLTFLPERILGLGQWAILPVLALTCYRLARLAGADDSASVLAGLGLLTVPIISIEAIGAESGGLALAFFAIAVYFALHPGYSRLRYVVAGLSAGLAFGFKSLYLMGITYLLLACMWQAYMAVPRAAGAGRIAPAISAGAIFGFSTLLLASFWLVRSYIEYHNPLFPVYIAPIFDLLGWLKAPDIDYSAHSSGQHQYQWVQSSHEWLMYPWVEWNRNGFFYRGKSGLGSFFATIVPVAVAFTVFDILRALRRRRWLATDEIRLLLLLGSVFLVVLWWVLGDRQPRYASGALIFLFPLAATTIAATGGRVRQLYHVLGAICIIWMFFVFLSREIVEFGDRVLYSRHFTRHAAHEYPEAIDSLKPGSTIVNLSYRARNYSLFGANFQNHVIRYLVSARTFGIDAPKIGWTLSLDGDTKGLYFSAEKMKLLGATHVYIESKLPISSDDCINLREIDRLELNPVNDVPYELPRILYEVDYCAEFRNLMTEQ